MAQNSSCKITVLITGGGGPGYPLFYKALRDSKVYKIKVVAVDLNKYAGNLYKKEWVDVAYHVLPNNSPKYFNQILRIIENENVDILISAVDEELSLFSKNRERLKESGCYIVLPPVHALENSYDKGITYTILQEKFKMPKTFVYNPGLDMRKIFDQLDGKVVIKLSRSRGNRFAYIIDNYEELRFYVKKLDKTKKDFLIQQYIGGREFNISLMFDKEGKCIYSICREKMDPPAIRPNTTAGLIRRNKEMEQAAIDATKMMELFPGTSNVEFLMDKKGGIYLIEINGGRHAAQDMNLIHCGINIPEMIISMAIGKDVQPIDDFQIKEGAFCLKYTDEIIVDFSDVATL